MFTAATAYVYYVNRHKLGAEQHVRVNDCEEDATMQFVRALDECLVATARNTLDLCGVGLRLAGMPAAVDVAVCKVLYTAPLAEVVLWKPPITVHAHDFTAYLDAPMHSRAEESSEPHIFDILVECRRSTGRPGAATPVAEARCGNKVKLTTLCQPLAWRPGNPFGILAACTAQQLSKLAEAFVQRRLYIDDDVMEIEQISSVTIEGVARQLLRSESQSCLDEVDSGSKLRSNLRQLADDDAPLDGSRYTFDQGEGSNAGRASSPAAAAAAPLSVVVTTPAECDDADIQGSGDLCCAENSQADDLSASGRQAADTRQTPKAVPMRPPNILVYTGGPSRKGKQGTVRADTGSDSEFGNVVSLLESCLQPFNYAIYHFGIDEAKDCSAPWADNCAALVFTRHAAPPEGSHFLAAVLDYFRSGGTVVSLCSDVDQHFLRTAHYGAASPDGPHEASQVLAVQATMGEMFKACLSSCHYQGKPQGCISDVAVRTLARDPSGNAVATEIRNASNMSGCALLLRVHAEMSAAAACAADRSGHDRELLHDLVQAGNARLAFLRSVLRCGGLRVSEQGEEGAQPQPTHCLLLATDTRLRDGFVEAVKSSEQLTGKLDSDGSLTHSDVVYNLNEEAAAAASPAAFDWSSYESGLTSRSYGRVVLYQQVARTTQTLLEPFMFSLPRHVNAVAVATRQTQGQGRGGNAWLSPPGCAMATLHLRVPLSSELGQAPAFLQMVPAVAVAMAIKSFPGYENVEIKVKWPNDIYYGGHAKLGGVLVQSTLMGQVFHALVGFGVNVANQHPTCCINDLVAHGGTASSGAVLPKPLTVELVLARVISLCEQLVDLFQRDKSAFLKLYYEHWLHSDGAIVNVQEQPNVADGQIMQGDAASLSLTSGCIQGVDDAGYLVVKTDDGRMLSLQPDGNTFDIMRNLIVRKKL